MDRTSALDSAFLQLEDQHSSLHIASVAIFEGPAPAQPEIVAAISRKLDLVPRFRQRLVEVPLSLGRPVWVDDPTFDVTGHLSRLAVPAPGGTEELREVVEQVLSRGLDHGRPLWEDVVIEGLADGRWAMVTKVHHTMVDGIAGTDLLSTVLDRDDDPAPQDGADAGTEPWAPDPTPGPVRLMTDAVRDQARLRARELAAVPRAARDTLHPSRLASSAYRTAQGLLGFARAAVPTTASSLIGPLGTARGYHWTEVELVDVLAIRSTLGGTLNDVVLAAVTAAFRTLLTARGEEADPHAVRCLVPVSVRKPSEAGVVPDNEVSALLLTLPVELADAHDRFNEIAVRMRTLKSSHEAEAGEQVTAFADALPPPAMTAFLHLAFRTPHRHLTTVTTNVPGPSSPLSLAGRPMLATYPYVPIADRLRVGVAVTSYGSRLFFGITTDRDSTPDAQVFADGLDAGFADLSALAGLRPHPEGTVQ